MYKKMLEINFYPHISRYTIEVLIIIGKFQFYCRYLVGHIGYRYDVAQSSV
jgi:hypothetical protein